MGLKTPTVCRLPFQYIPVKQIRVFEKISFCFHFKLNSDTFGRKKNLSFIRVSNSSVQSLSAGKTTSEASSRL